MSPKCESSGPGLFHFLYFRRLGVVLLFAALFTSCRRPSGPIAQEQTNLSWLGNMYGMYISQNQGHAPKTIDELRKFVEKTTTAEQLGRLKVANVGELFVSPRDGKPFAMVSYDKLPSPKGGEAPPIVLYESQGSDGKRAVVFLGAGAGTRTIDEAELQRMLPAQSRPAR